MPRTREAHGWGLRVDGKNPYLAGKFFQHQGAAQQHSLDRAVRMVILSLGEYRRLRRIEKNVSEVSEVY